MPLAIFDLDNTLLDRTVPFRRWATKLVADRGADPADVDWLTDRDNDGYTPREEFLSAVRDRYGLTEPIEDLLARFREQIVALSEVDPAVLTALAALRAAGWQLVIATNGGTDQQLAKIKVTGLAAYVDAIAVSEEVGAAKPDRPIFAEAARRCGATLDHGGWMIGDSVECDVVGGQDAGLRTIWLHRGRNWDSRLVAPDAVVGTVAAAVAVLLASAHP